MIAAGIATLTVAAATLVIVGPEGLGMATLGICYFMAPYFRAFPLVSGTAISAIDPLLMASVFFLLPRIARGRTKVSPLYLGSAVSLVVIGTVAALASSETAATLLEVSQWAFLVLILPLALIALDLSNREIVRLALIYIAGQMLSSVVAVANGPDPANHRYEGLAAHPNYFADGAMMSAALLLYLYHHPRAKSVWARSAWWAVMAICLVAINVSGSRGAALGVAAVFVLVPIVEKSTLSALVAMSSVALGLVFLQPLLGSGDQGSTLARTTGQDGSGSLTTTGRLNEWHDAFGHIQNSPFLGNGLSLDILSFHNNYLEIVAGIGIFGFVAYLLMLWSLTRGLFGPSIERRLLYPMVAFAVFGLTQPGFKDRSNWLPMLLGIAVFHGYRYAARSRTRQQSEPTGRALAVADG